MPTESKGLTAQRIRKERALASLREHQLDQLEGRLLGAAEVEAAWSGQLARIRDAVLAIPARVAPRFPDPRHAEAIIRKECELALRTLAGDAD